MRCPRIICVLLFIFLTFAGCKKDATQESTVNATAPDETTAAQDGNQQAPTQEAQGARPSGPIEFTDVTDKAGIHFKHNSGAFGKKYLPETLGPGCAFLDYDNDGWQDILLINGASFAGHAGARTTLTLYKNNRDGTFRDVTRQAGLDIPLYGLGVAVGDYNNDGFTDIFVSCVGQSRLFQNT